MHHGILFIPPLDVQQTTPAFTGNLFACKSMEILNFSVLNASTPFFTDFLSPQIMVQVIEGRIYINDLRETKITSSYGGFELPRVKLQQMYDGNPGEIDFGSSKCEVRVSEGSSYRELTASQAKEV